MSADIDQNTDCCQRKGGLNYYSNANANYAQWLTIGGADDRMTCETEL